MSRPRSGSTAPHRRTAPRRTSSIPSLPGTGGSPRCRGWRFSRFRRRLRYRHFRRRNPTPGWRAQVPRRRWRTATLAPERFGAIPTRGLGYPKEHDFGTRTSGRRPRRLDLQQSLRQRFGRPALTGIGVARSAPRRHGARPPAPTRCEGLAAYAEGPWCRGLPAPRVRRGLRIVDELERAAGA